MSTKLSAYITHRVLKSAIPSNSSRAPTKMDILGHTHTSPVKLHSYEDMWTVNKS